MDKSGTCLCKFLRFLVFAFLFVVAMIIVALSNALFSR